uniref:DUF1758 domain-containing protein n=1 Tax=Trichuris muris TaxID=70415 RepID=A0A5S6R0P4_TRIMR
MGKGISNGLTVDDIFLASLKRLLPCASRKRWEQRTRTYANEKVNTSMFLSFLHEEMDIQDAAAEAQTASTKQFMGHSSRRRNGHPHGVTLGDSFPRGPPTVDVLIGADYYHDFLRPGELRGHVDHPIAVPSTLGWIVCDITNKRVQTVLDEEPS